MKRTTRWAFKALRWVLNRVARLHALVPGKSSTTARAMLRYQAIERCMRRGDAEGCLRYLSTELAVERQRSPFSPRVRKRTEELKELTASVRAM